MPPGDTGDLRRSYRLRHRSAEEPEELMPTDERAKRPIRSTWTVRGDRARASARGPEPPFHEKRCPTGNVGHRWRSGQVTRGVRVPRPGRPLELLVRPDDGREALGRRVCRAGDPVDILDPAGEEFEKLRTAPGTESSAPGRSRAFPSPERPDRLRDRAGLHRCPAGVRRPRRPRARRHSAPRVGDEAPPSRGPAGLRQVLQRPSPSAE